MFKSHISLDFWLENILSVFYINVNIIAISNIISYMNVAKNSWYDTVLEPWAQETDATYFLTQTTVIF